MFSISYDVIRVTYFILEFVCVMVCGIFYGVGMATLYLVIAIFERDIDEKNFAKK